MKKPSYEVVDACLPGAVRTTAGCPPSPLPYLLRVGFVRAKFHAKRIFRFERRIVHSKSARARGTLLDVKRRHEKKARARALAKPPSVRTDAEGRVHLVLHRDPETGQSLVTLEAPIFEESWQNDVAAAAANTAYASL